MGNWNSSVGAGDENQRLAFGTIDQFNQDSFIVAKARLPLVSGMGLCRCRGYDGAACRNSSSRIWSRK